MVSMSNGKSITIEMKVGGTTITTTCETSNAATVIENVCTFARSLIEGKEIWLGGEVKNPLPVNSPQTSRDRVEQIWRELFQQPVPQKIEEELKHRGLDYDAVSNLSDPDLVDLLCLIKYRLEGKFTAGKT